MKKVYHRIVNNKIEKGRKILDKHRKIDIITYELHTSLIKSGGGNGPMKPGNLLRNCLVIPLCKVPNPAANER